MLIENPIEWLVIQHNAFAIASSIYILYFCSFINSIFTFIQVKAWLLSKHPTASTEPAALMAHPAVQALVSEEIVSACAGLKSYERPHVWMVILEPFTTVSICVVGPYIIMWTVFEFIYIRNGSYLSKNNNCI